MTDVEKGQKFHKLIEEYYRLTWEIEDLKEIMEILIIVEGQESIKESEHYQFYTKKLNEFEKIQTELKESKMLNWDKLLIPEFK